ncbi:MAG: WbqC family protein [Alphaproteobacteria bacterium]|jgi:hypothetical protein|nr:WbqC family protein [Alphaproteobacteria bacterium]
MHRVAIMQPYFFPYAGYYRLFAAADVFIVLDSVQFPRRGWVHRNRLRRADGELDWLTLPLSKAPQSAQIRELEFRQVDPGWAAEQRARFPVLITPSDTVRMLIDHALHPAGKPLDHLVAGLRATTRLLGLERPMILASSLEIDPALRAQDLIIALARAVGANGYVNLSGGGDLYTPAVFRDAGLDLQILPPYRGDYASILERLAGEPPTAVAADIRSQITP